MPNIHQSSVVEDFVSALGEEIGCQNALEIAVSDLGALGLKCAQKRVVGFQWIDSLPAECKYDYVVADLPFGMPKEWAKVGNKEIMLILLCYLRLAD